MARVIEDSGRMERFRPTFSNSGSAAAAGAVAAPSGNAANSIIQGNAAPNAIANVRGTNPPNEGLYGEYQAHALDAFNKAKISIQQKRSGIFNSYGFNSDGSVDGNNMVGGYQQMKHNQANELGHAENIAQERGLGGTGLGAQVANAPRFQEDADSAAFASSYLSDLQGADQDLSGAEGKYQQDLLDARRRQIEDDIANGRYDEAPAPGDPASPGSSSGPSRPSKPGTRATTAAARLAKVYGGVRPDDRQGIRGPSAPIPAPIYRDTRPKTVVYKGRH